MKRVSIAVALHLLVALPLAYLLNVWADEASTLYSTGHGIGFALTHALADEKQAPLYFWFLSLWRLADESVFFARLFSIACSVGAIFLFRSVAGRFLEPRPALFVAFLFALHPFLFWTSLEARVYSAVILVSLALIGIWTGEYLDREGRAPRAGAIVGMTVLAIVALYTNYYLGFLLAGLFVGLVAARRWRAAGVYLGQMAVAGVAFVPLVLAVRSQFAANTVAFQDERDLLTFAQIFWNHLLTFLLPTELYPGEEITSVSWVRVWGARAAIPLFVYFLYKARREVFDSRVSALAAAVATIFAFLALAYFLLGPVYVGLRHFAVVFGPFALLASVVLVRLVPGRYWIAVAVLYAFLFGYSMFTLYPGLAKRGDWKRVAEFIEKNERPGQPILVFTAFESLSLPVHYRGENRILPDEKFFDWELEAENGTPDAWRRQIEFLISEIQPATRELWLVTGEKCSIKDSCLPLEKFVEANYTIETEKDFYLEKVRLLRKKE
jgi:hypothetical protein